MAYDFSKMTKTGRELNAEKLKLDMKKAATRVNSMEPTHYLTYKSDKASNEIRKHQKPMASYASRRPPGTVSSPTHNTLKDKDTYYTGMGEVGIALRPGALDFKKYPSKGIG